MHLHGAFLAHTGQLQVVVASSNNFADGRGISDRPVVSVANSLSVSDDAPLVVLTVDSSDRHPLRSLSGSPTSPTRHGDTSRSEVSPQKVTEGETRPWSTRLVSEQSENDRATHPDDSDVTDDEPTEHTVSSTDTFAGLAIRYGVSIAALRRANQLWPSDPIHLRTKLLIPRGDRVPVKGKLAINREVHVSPVPHDLPSRTSSSDLVAALISARSAVLSAFPARMSLDSLSSRASVSEDHELEDLADNPHKLTPKARHDTSSIDDHHHYHHHHHHHELPILMSSDDVSNPSTLLPLSQLSCTVADDQLQPSLHTRDPRPHSAHQSRRTQASVFVPVRISQLEPEPAMELPSRRAE